jgi:hypothetical protein
MIKSNDNHNPQFMQDISNWRVKRAQKGRKKSAPCGRHLKTGTKIPQKASFSLRHGYVLSLKLSDPFQSGRMHDFQVYSCHISDSGYGSASFI